MLALLLLACPLGMAQAPPPAPLPRRILAIHDVSRHEQDLAADPVHGLLEMPLQHLGLLVERYPYESGPPSQLDWEGLGGLVMYLGHSPIDPSNPDWLAGWIEREVLPRHIPIVLFGGLGPMTSPINVDESDLYKVLGLQTAPVWLKDPLRVQMQLRSQELCAMEIPVFQPVYFGTRLPAEGVRPWIRLSVEGLPDVSPVFTAPWGGIALGPYLADFSNDTGYRRLHLNLIEFLREALQLEGRPIPDPCVINGRRTFFCQVDGDGFESYSTIQSGKTSAEVFANEILERMELPFSVSVIVASLTKELEPPQPTAAMRLAAKILAMPRVEPASHTVLHPLEWNAPIPAVLRPHEITWYAEIEGYRYDPEQEVRASVAFIDRYLMPAGKRCKLMLWSGDAIAPTQALRAAYELGLENVNGGTFRWDDEFNSRAYVRPLARFQDGFLQVYCGVSNENMFEGYFDSMPSAFAHIATTIERTGNGPILKPANVYVHFYGAERPARLKAMVDLLQRFGIDEESTPIFASLWWRLVSDALLETEIEQIDNRTFRIANFGACRTVRLDGESRHVDLWNSDQVLGFRRLHDALYVHLAASPATLRLTDKAPDRPYLEQASYPIEDGRRDGQRLAWTASSVAHRTTVWAGFEPHAKLFVNVGDERREVMADATGRYRLELPPGSDRLEVRQP